MSHRHYNDNNSIDSYPPGGITMSYSHTNVNNSIGSPRDRKNVSKLVFKTHQEVINNISPILYLLISETYQ